MSAVKVIQCFCCAGRANAGVLGGEAERLLGAAGAPLRHAGAHRLLVPGQVSHLLYPPALGFAPILVLRVPCGQGILPELRGAPVMPPTWVSVGKNYTSQQVA